MVLQSTSTRRNRSWIGFLCACGAGLAFVQPVNGQNGPLPLQDLSSFKNAGSTWQIAGNVSAVLGKANTLKTSPGNGVLVNLPGRKKHGEDLYTGFEHGDIDLELDYMMAEGSNSGIYLQGRYELQLLDSWGATTPKPSDNGGIYERWDDSKPEGQKGYQGYAPRQNASKAPGLWQHLKVSFQAPRFDASGNKIENARILRAELNGVVIHENVELMGSTRGAAGAEKATGPLRIQGDHGAVAFRNVSIRAFTQARPQLTDLSYQLFNGKFSRTTDFSKEKAVAGGAAKALSANPAIPAKEYVLQYKGTLRVPEAGEYQLSLASQGGGAMLKVAGQTIGGQGGNARGKVTLPAGDTPVEILYARTGDWGSPSLTLALAGAGLREFTIGDAPAPDQTDPIVVDAAVNTVLRSFMDVPGQAKVVHAVSVGSPEKVHYTYDLDKGMVVQAWRGNFLETTPMWHERGNGTARPQGALQRFGKPYFVLARLAGEQAAWSADSTGSGYRPKGYVLDAQDRPTFRYQIFGSNVSDQLRVAPEGHGIERELTVTAPAGDLYAKLAEGEQIELLEKDLYSIDGKAYYLRLIDAGGAKPVLRDAGKGKELIIPVRGTLRYSILF
ncbi:family 16 glycoside hydrolase [Chitinophaga lutea]